MLEKLFESLDEKVFTADLKESLEAQFNEAVESKSTLIAEARIEEEVDSLNEKSESHIEFLNEKAQEFTDMKQAEMIDSLDKYLERIVEEFMVEADEALQESVKSEKADMIIEAFDTMLTATGVEVAKIVEAKDNSSVELKLDEAVVKYDTLVEENIALKESNDMLIQMGVINEMKEGLSIVESEKFEKLADLVQFTKDEGYTTKLETIKESIKSSVESDTIDKLEENAKIEETTVASWAHLV